MGTGPPPDAPRTPYGYGFEAFEDGRAYRCALLPPAILFILFDQESPLFRGRSLKEIGIVSFWAMMIFLAIPVVGFVYEWKKGALDWE